MIRSKNHPQDSYSSTRGYVSAPLKSKADALWVTDFHRRLDPTYTKGNGNYWRQIEENPWRGIRDLAIGHAATNVFIVQAAAGLSMATIAVVPDLAEAATGSKTTGNLVAAGMDAGAYSAVPVVGPALGTYTIGDAAWHTSSGRSFRHKIESIYRGETVSNIRHAVEKVAEKASRAASEVGDFLKKLF